MRPKLNAHKRLTSDARVRAQRNGQVVEVE